MDEREILEIFSQVVQAIKHIHQHNVLHRSVNVDRVMVNIAACDLDFFGRGREWYLESLYLLCFFYLL